MYVPVGVDVFSLDHVLDVRQRHGGEHAGKALPI
jgi:hypothetical protein